MIWIATLSDAVELEMLKSLYEENHVHYWMKHRETGEFIHLYMGHSPFGVDIYVPEAEYDEARALYEGFFKGNYSPVEETQSDQ